MMNFLEQRANNVIRREMRSIVDSYHHYWDPIAELLQNSRDAIERKIGEGSKDEKIYRNGCRRIQPND